MQGKRAIVTGGSRGIGKAVAWELAREGVDVAIAARSAGPLADAAREMAAATGRKIIAVPADTTSAEDVTRLVETAVRELGGVDILVNNAAPVNRTPSRSFEAIGADLFWAEMNVKVLGYLRCAQAVAPHMKAQGWGRIVNISGLAARRSGSAIGSMRNVAVSALTKNLADELGPQGVNVTVVHPGATRTEATAAMVAGLAERRGVSLEEAERLMGTNSLHRLIDAREVAYVVAFLASPKSAAINGDAVAAGGGMGGSIHY